MCPLMVREVRRRKSYASWRESPVGSLTMRDLMMSLVRTRDTLQGCWTMFIAYWGGSCGQWHATMIIMLTRHLGFYFCIFFERHDVSGCNQNTYFLNLWCTWMQTLDKCLFSCLNLIMWWWCFYKLRKCLSNTILATTSFNTFIRLGICWYEIIKIPF